MEAKQSILSSSSHLILNGGNWQDNWEQSLLQMSMNPSTLFFYNRRIQRKVKQRFVVRWWWQHRQNAHFIYVTHCYIYCCCNVMYCTTCCRRKSRIITKSSSNNIGARNWEHPLPFKQQWLKSSLIFFTTSIVRHYHHRYGMLRSHTFYTHF